MKVLHLSMHENTGAGKAATRLHHGLINQNMDSLVLVSQKSSDLNFIVKPKPIVNLYKKIQQISINKFINKLVNNNQIFSVNFTPTLITQEIEKIQPDIINLHWIGWEFVRIEALNKFNLPLVWTLHDSWAFTGGCHVPYDCKNYTDSCGSCPQLKGDNDRDLSRWVWQRKAKAWQNLNLTIVTPSKWLAQCATSSSLFRDLRVEVIPNSLDITKYKPIEVKLARDILNLPQDKQLIMFGSMDARDINKGFHLLQPALQHLSQSEWKDRLEIVIFGASEPINPVNLGFKCHYLGRLNDDISLALSYSAASVMVVPSIQENLSNTVMEALACGTPCVAFNIGGMADMIDHKQNGYLATPFAVEDLAKGIAWVLENTERYQTLKKFAYNKVAQEFNQQLQSQRYLSLYKELTSC